MKINENECYDVLYKELEGYQIVKIMNADCTKIEECLYYDNLNEAKAIIKFLRKQSEKTDYLEFYYIYTLSKVKIIIRNNKIEKIQEIEKIDF